MGRNGSTCGRCGLDLEVSKRVSVEFAAFSRLELHEFRNHLNNWRSKALKGNLQNG